MSTAQTQVAEALAQNAPPAGDPLTMALRETERVKAELATVKGMADVAYVEGLGPIPTNLAGAWRLAQMYAKSDLVPDHFKNKPENCCIAIEMAIRCKCNILMFLQKCYIVHGKPSIEAVLAISLANSSKIFKGNIRYEMIGKESDEDNFGCIARATIAETGETIEQVMTIGVAKRMGWLAKSDSMWKKMPDQMLKYRSAMWLIRANCPEVILGMLSAEEAKDTFEETITRTEKQLAKRKASPGRTATLEEVEGAPEAAAKEIQNEREADLEPKPGETVKDGGEIVDPEPKEDVSVFDQPLDSIKDKLGPMVFKALVRAKLNTIGDLDLALSGDEIKDHLDPNEIKRVTKVLKEVAGTR